MMTLYPVTIHKGDNRDLLYRIWCQFPPQYYKRIEPADAHVLEKRLRPRKDADVNGSAAPATAAKAAKEE